MLSFNQLSGPYVSDLSGNTTVGTFSSSTTVPPSTAGNLNNTAVGYGALRNSAGGQHNIAVGVNALNNNLQGNNNIAIGENALFNFTSPTTVQVGDSNIAIGNNSLSGNTGGGNIIAIGHSTNANNIDNCILIGNGVGATGP